MDNKVFQATAMVATFLLGIMKNLILACLCNAVLLAVMCLPAEARTVVGLASPAARPIDPKTVEQLENNLGAVSGVPIQIRLLEDDAAVARWLLRFQEIDAAIVEHGFIAGQPSGTLSHLADLHPVNASGPRLALVVRNNMSSSQSTQIKNGFLKLADSEAGRDIIQDMGWDGVTLPGTQLRNKKPAPAPLPVQSARQTVLPKEPSRKQTISVQDEPLSATKETAATADKPKEPTMLIPPPALREETKTAADDQQPTAAVTDTTAPVAQEITRSLPERKPVAKKQETSSRPAESIPAPNRHTVFFIVLIILAAVLLKLWLFARRRSRRKEAAARSGESPIVDIVLDRRAESAAAPMPTEGAIDGETVIEAGQLGPGMTPDLLKRCAGLPEPAFMQVTKGSTEKLVYFFGGQISSALTHNVTTPESEARSTKLGNLLVRDDLITKEERQQGLELLEREPGLSFGEALIKLGFIEPNDLRDALVRQAKVTIYSLILFPEGRYKVLAGGRSLPPEERLELDVTSLLREVSNHNSEWAEIRQALPNLNAALDFCESDRCEQETTDLSSQQQAILSLVDGKRSINDLCAESGMMDYEVYRFLYSMVTAGVLK